MRRSERYAFILRYFSHTLPVATTELHYGSAFQLLVATVLSAQCTDVRVNLITPALFRAYPDAQAMSAATEEEIYSFIRSVSYPHAKARHLRALATALVTKHEGLVPADDAALCALPGVGRKTANVVLAVWYHLPRLAVDTHVFRVAHRLGLVAASATTPAKVEQTLCQQIPPALRATAHHWLLLHGRHICQSRRPRCEQCPFVSFCPTAAKNKRNDV